MRDPQPHYRKGPIGRLLINKTKHEYAHLDPRAPDFFAEMRQCYDDCRWSDADAVIFQACVPETPSVLETLARKGYALVRGSGVVSASGVTPSPPSSRLRLQEPPPPQHLRLEAARWVLEADRIIRARKPFSCPRSVEGLDDDRDIVPEPAHFLPTAWLQADAYLVNLTHWHFVCLSPLHSDLRAELAFLTKENAWKASDKVALCIDHTRGRALRIHLERKGVGPGVTMESHTFALPRF